MKKIKLDNITELAEIMHEDVHDGNCVAAILFYDEAIELMRELLCYDCVIPESFEISPEDWNGYGQEYFVQLGDDMMLAVEPACHDGIYYTCGADYLYVDHHADSDVLDRLDGACFLIDMGKEDCDFKYHDQCKTNVETDDNKLDKLISTAKVTRDDDGITKRYELDLDLLLDYLFGD